MQQYKLSVSTKSSFSLNMQEEVEASARLAEVSSEKQENATAVVEEEAAYQAVGGTCLPVANLSAAAGKHIKLLLGQTISLTFRTVQAQEKCRFADIHSLPAH